MWVFWMAAALASPVWDVLAADDLRRSGRPEDASAAAAELLSADRDDLGAHHVYVTTRVRAMRDGPATIVQYRRWTRRNPESVAARFGLATALTQNAIPEDRNGEWCGEALELLSDLPIDAEDGPWVLDARLTVHDYCPSSGAEDRRALAALDSDLARAWTIRNRARSGVITEATAEDLARLVKRAPELAGQAGALRYEDMSGDGLDRAKEVLRTSQRALVEDSRPFVVAYAASALLALGERSEGERALVRLARIDPGRSAAVPITNGTARWYLRQRPGVQERDPRAVDWRLRDALEHDDPDRAIAALRELKAMWQRDRHDYDAAHAFAVAAGHHGLEIDGAIVALGFAINSVPAWDARGTSRAADYLTWRREQAERMGSWLATRGWLMHLTGRSEYASQDLRKAILMHPDPPAVMHLRLGLIYYELGYEQDALHHLAMGLQTPTEDPEAERARVVAKDLYARLAWSPDGLDGWIASHAEAQD